MGEAYITRRGGGGMSPYGAVIHVNAPKDSDVSFSRGGVIAKVIPANKSHVNAENSDVASYYFSIGSGSYGEWTITATDGASTASTTVLVTSNKEYEVELSYLVPAEYQAVEYLERPVQSGAYFNTGIVPLRTDFVEVRFKVLLWAAYPWPLGLEVSSSSYWGVNYNASGKFAVYYSSQQYQDNLSGYTNTDNVVQWKEANTIRISNDDGATFTDYSKTQSYNPTNPFCIFAIGSGLVGKGDNNIRVKRVTIADAEIVPCYRKSDSVPGLWNRRDKVFLENLGNGTVIAGPDL